MVTQQLSRLKPESRRRAWRLFRIIVDVYRHQPEAVGTLERVVGALEVHRGERRDRQAARSH